MCPDTETRTHCLTNNNFSFAFNGSKTSAPRSCDDKILRIGAGQRINYG